MGAACACVFGIVWRAARSRLLKGGEAEEEERDGGEDVDAEPENGTLERIMLDAMQALHGTAAKFPDRAKHGTPAFSCRALPVASCRARPSISLSPMRTCWSPRGRQFRFDESTLKLHATQQHAQLFE